MIQQLSLAAIGLCIAACFAIAQETARPLKVFVLAGQSKMQGHAHISTIDFMADDPKTAPLLNEMQNLEGTSRVCKNVWISSVGCLGDRYSDLNEQTGKRTVGFGAGEEKIGPEFQGNVIAVPTSPYWDDRLGEIDRKHDEVRQMLIC